MTTRRDFIALLGGSAIAWPLAAHAQQRESMRRIGALVQTEFRWPAGDTARMATEAMELVRHRPDVILTHASPATAAVREATRTIPNVFVVVADPVGSGLVESIPDRAVIRPASRISSRRLAVNGSRS